jgi:hypothetical protein
VRGYTIDEGPPVDLRPVKEVMRLDGTAQPPLEPHDAPEGYLRLYRVQRTGKAADLSEWTHANHGGWFSLNLQAALRDDSQRRRLLAVDVRESIAKGLKVSVQGRPSMGSEADFRLPPDLASLAREIGTGVPTGTERGVPEPPTRDLWHIEVDLHGTASRQRLTA